MFGGVVDVRAASRHEEFSRFSRISSKLFDDMWESQGRSARCNRISTRCFRVVRSPGRFSEQRRSFSSLKGLGIDDCNAALPLC